MSAIPTCCITGRIAGDPHACGDCDPCILGAKDVPDSVKRLIVERDEWADKYAGAMMDMDERSAENERLRAALEFYRDPFAWKKLHDKDNDIQVPDFYSETTFGDTAEVALCNQPPERRYDPCKCISRGRAVHKCPFTNDCKPKETARGNQQRRDEP